MLFTILFIYTIVAFASGLIFGILFTKYAIKNKDYPVWQVPLFALIFIIIINHFSSTRFKWQEILIQVCSTLVICFGIYIGQWIKLKEIDSKPKKKAKPKT